MVAASKYKLFSKCIFCKKLITLFVLLASLYGCTGLQGFTSVETKLNQTSSPLVSVPSRSGLHKVHKGETLYSIAFRYGWKFQALARTNNIKKPYTIYPGQEIKVAKSSSVQKNVNSAPKTGGKKLTNSTNIQVKHTNSGPSIRQSGPKPPLKNFNLRWQWPAKGSLIAGFLNNKPGAKGIDIAGRMGESVSAAATGRVVYAGNGLLGYGNLIIIKHSEKFLSAYAHNRKILVKEQQDVTVGQPIAEIGATGSDKVKLHFEIRRDGKPVDPLKYLPRR